MSETVLHPRRAEMDAFDDGGGPYMVDSATPPFWDDFKAWAADELGQGYSLACAEGSILDAVTRWCFAGYRAGWQRAQESAERASASPNYPAPDGRETARQDIQSPFNACMFRDYCRSLERKGNPGGNWNQGIPTERKE